MDPRQMELSLPEPLPKGASKVTPLVDRVAVLEFVCDILMAHVADLDMPEMDRAHLLSAHAILQGASGRGKKSRGETDGA